MQNFLFENAVYSKKIKQKQGTGFSIILVVIILLCGLAMFLKPKQTNLVVPYCYFVEVGCFDSYSRANILASDVQSAGGAGFVHYDGNYHVLTSCYPNEEDAQKVCENIKQTYPSACVFTSFIDNSLLKNLESKSEDVKTIFRQNNSLIESLYSNINDFANKQFSFAVFKTKIAKTYNDFCAQILVCENLPNNNPLVQVKNDCLNIKNCIENIKNTQESENFSQVCNYNLINIVFINRNIVNRV